MAHRSREEEEEDRGWPGKSRGFSGVCNHREKWEKARSQTAITTNGGLYPTGSSSAAAGLVGVSAGQSCQCTTGRSRRPGAAPAQQQRNPALNVHELMVIDGTCHNMQSRTDRAPAPGRKHARGAAAARSDSRRPTQWPGTTQASGFGIKGDNERKKWQKNCRGKEHRRARRREPLQYLWGSQQAPQVAGHAGAASRGYGAGQAACSGWRRGPR